VAQEEEIAVGTIEFKGDTTFELKLQKDPIVDVSGTNVILAFPVFVADLPGQVAPVLIAIPHHKAEWLLDQIRIAISIARDNQLK
jgi:hypothetical protein